MSDVTISPDETAHRIRAYVLDHPELIYEEYESPPNSLNGACYVLSESYFHAMGGTDSDLDIYCLSWGDVYDHGEGTHWYLRDAATETWVDLGLDIPEEAGHIPFEDGTRRAFITGYRPSKRAQSVLDSLNLSYSKRT